MTVSERTGPRRVSGVRLLSAGAIVATVAAAMAWYGPSRPPRAVDVQPGVVRYVTDDLVYTFHLVSGTEGLFERRRSDGSGPNLVRTRPDEARRMRLLLEAELNVDSLEELREPYRRTIDRLRALGYL